MAAVDPPPQAPSLAPVFRVVHGQATLKGRFHANEDRISVTSLSQTPEGPGGCLVLLCDGHDGSACATFVQARFPRDLSSAAGGAGVALTDAFAHVESAWIAHVRSARAHGGARVGGGISSGACVTAVLVRGAHIAAANVGDARAILRRADGSVTVLTDDHRCSNPAERERLLRLGGPSAIRNGRAVGVLEPTRTIGDLEEKAVAGPGVISAVPAVSEVELVSGDVGPTPPLPAAAAAQGTAGGHMGPSPSPGIPAGATAAQRSKAGAVLAGARGEGGAGRGGSLAARAALTTTLSSLGFGGGLPGAAAATAAYGGAASVAARTRGRAAPPPPPALTVAQATATARLSRVCCVVAASDGVWDVLPSGAAAAVAVHVLETRGDPAAAAAELVALAQRLGSADDITAAVVWIQDEGRGQQQQQQQVQGQEQAEPAGA